MPLGAGGMGEVYRARDSRLGREVALKVLPPELLSNREGLLRFAQEARSASALNHPHIVSIFEIGEADSSPYLVMELIDGHRLRDLISGGPLPIRRTLDLLLQLVEGLAKAHEAGIVHRDLKPENVMVTRDGFVKILDFGLAKLQSSLPSGSQRLTQTGIVIGTPEYMSPEQAAGRAVDFRSDQFSLGVLAYEMLTGRRAFRRPTAVQTLSAIIQEDPEPLETLRTRVPAPLRWTIERCLAKEPEERYASTRDLARDLRQIRENLSELSSGEARTARTEAGGTRTLAERAGKPAPAAPPKALRGLGASEAHPSGRRVPSRARGGRRTLRGRGLGRELVSRAPIRAARPELEGKSPLRSDDPHHGPARLARRKDTRVRDDRRIGLAARGHDADFGRLDGPHASDRRRLCGEGLLVPRRRQDLLRSGDRNRGSDFQHPGSRRRGAPGPGECPGTRGPPGRKPPARSTRPGPQLSIAPVSSRYGAARAHRPRDRGREQYLERARLSRRKPGDFRASFPTDPAKVRRVYSLDLRTVRPSRRICRSRRRFAVAADGASVLALVTFGDLQQVVQVTADGTQAKTLFPITGRAWNLDSAPDGGVFLVTMDNPVELLRFPATGGVPREDRNDRRVPADQPGRAPGRGAARAHPGAWPPSAF